MLEEMAEAPIEDLDSDEFIDVDDLEDSIED